MDNILNEHDAICKNNKVVISKRTNSDGRFSYRFQCVNCGYAVGQATKKPNEENIRLFDEVRYNESKDLIYKYRNKVWIESQTEKHIEFDYNKYLQTKEWIETRGKRLLIDNYMCVFCGNKNHLHVHHKTYKNLRNEDVENDLVTLCKVCHEKIHRLIL